MELFHRLKAVVAQTPGRTRRYKASPIPPLVAFALCIGGLACKRESEHRPEVASIPRSVANVPLAKELTTPAARTPEDFRKELENRFRLRPDRRFTRALSDVHQITGGGHSLPTVTFDEIENVWRIAAGEFQGTLPLLPDFSDGFELLLEEARKQLATSPQTATTPVIEEIGAGIEAALHDYLGIYSADALRLVDQAWQQGQRDPRLAEWAARGLTALCFQQFDSLYDGDPLCARALAALAVARAQTPNVCQREEVLLAWWMGYDAHARETALDLPEDDAIRRYVLHQDYELLEQAVHKGAPPETRLLALSGVVRQNNMRLVWQALDALFPNQYSLPAVYKFAAQPLGDSAQGFLSVSLLLCLAEDIGVPDYLRPLARRMQHLPRTPEAIVYLAKNTAELPERRGEDMSLAFERGLVELHTKYSGPFLDPDLWQGCYRNAFVSAVYHLGRHMTNFLGSVPAARQFAAQVAEEPGTMLREYLDWYTLCTDAMAGDPVDAELQEAIDSGRFQPLAFVQTIHWLRSSSLPVGDTRAILNLQKLCESLDSRPEHLDQLADWLRETVYDLNRSDQLCQRLLEIAPENNHSRAAWWRVYTGHSEQLPAVLEETHPYPGAKLWVLKTLTSGPAPDTALIESHYKKLLRAFPDVKEVAEGYSAFLEKQGNYTEARRVLRHWLDLEIPAVGLSHSSIRNHIAALYLKEGKFAEAQASMDDDGSHWAMRLLMELKLKTGKIPQARRHARDILERYGDFTNAYASACSLHWALGEYEQAAEVLASSPHAITGPAFQEDVAPEFRECFGERPREEAVRAFQALAAKGFSPSDLRWMVYVMAAEPQTAFDMLQVLRHQPNIDGVATDCHAFQYLVKLKNKEEATAWIRPRIPEHLLYLAPVMFYEYGLYDLLWDILEHPDAPEHPDASMHADYVWLLRAAGSLHEQGANDSHMEQLKQYYEGHASRAYDTIGRYLLGLGPIEAVLTLAESDPKKLCEVAYFVGLKAETEEHFEEAADWYLICLGTGLTSNRECAWAYDTLRSWKNSGRRLRDKDTVEVEAPPDEAETVF